MAEKKMWGGRFKQGTATLVEEYTESVSYDRALYAQDIAGFRVDFSLAEFADPVVEQAAVA